MSDFGIAIEGNLKTALRFEQFPEAARQRLVVTITSLTARLYAKVVGAEPSRSGRLRSETKSGVTEKPNRVTGWVGFAKGLPKAEYGKIAALAYGAKGTAKVTAHSMRLDHVFANRLAEPMNVMVGAYSRHLNIAPHDFLRGPLASMRAEAIAEMKLAVAGPETAP